MHADIKGVGLLYKGNKCDIDDKKLIEDQKKSLAAELKMKFFETFALNGQNIKEAFEKLIVEIMKKKKIGNNNGKNIDLKKNKKKKEKKFY